MGFRSRLSAYTIIPCDLVRTVENHKTRFRLNDPRPRYEPVSSRMQVGFIASVPSHSVPKGLAFNLRKLMQKSYPT